MDSCRQKIYKFSQANNQVKINWSVKMSGPCMGVACSGIWAPRSRKSSALVGFKGLHLHQFCKPVCITPHTEVSLKGMTVQEKILLLFDA